MGKVIEFPTREKRIENLLREQLPLDLPSDEIEELAAELRRVAERIDRRRKTFNVFFPHTSAKGEIEFITKQVEEIIAELMRVIRDEEGEIFSLIVRYHLLLHEARHLSDTE